MKRLLIGLMSIMSLLTASAQDIYNITVKDDGGNNVQLSEYKGKVLLIVNTATKCGFTPQYKELESIYEKFSEKGFEILDFPCNQFGQQAPGSIEEIHEFCTANFNIQFRQFDKIDVNGNAESPLFTYLKSQKGFAGFDLNDPLGKLLDDNFRKQDPNYDQSPSIKWNFTKFLVARDGKVLKRYEPTAKMSDIEADIQKALGCCEKQKSSCCEKKQSKCCEKKESSCCEKQKSDCCKK